MSLKQILFGDLDLNSILDNPDFKEDSVREEVILPILKHLGYKQPDIVRSKSLQHPFLRIGSNKKRPIKLIPDYSLKVENNFAWVLDAKAPDEDVLNQDHIEQVYSYAIHPEIKSTYFAICNGVKFVLFRTISEGEPLLLFSIDEIDYSWERLQTFLSPNSFQFGKNITYDRSSETAKIGPGFDYANRPLLQEIPVHKRAAKRHFGVHGYFTKQSWNVVATYIKNYTKPGDIVLDPFGGIGITPIEAIMNNREAISIDLNPLPVFLVNALIAPIKEDDFFQAYNRVVECYKSEAPDTQAKIQRILNKYPYPKGFRLPRSSDVEVIEELFSEKQLAQLALLKHCIKQESNKNIQDSLMLMFSGLVTKVNQTYHTSKIATRDGQGDAAAFRYYRYRIAPEPREIDPLKYFELRFKKILAAKRDMKYMIDEDTIRRIKVLRGTATDLSWIPTESIDYIYTDPPYGKKIPYLDLSVMWNAWLDLEVTEEDYDLEAIEGGEKEKEKSEYNRLIADSIREMYRVLKFDRWMSFVFAHKDPEFWHLIIETAENCGFEYIGAVPQKNGQTSFKKRQHPFTVLSGQLIINFRKVRNPRAILKANLGADMAKIIIQTIEAVIAKSDGATLEQINDELIVKGLELGFLDLMKKEYSDLTPLLTQNFNYDRTTGKYTIPEDGRFQTQIDVKLRIRYYLLSFLRRKERENYNPTFDEIILYILPLLRNGITPENQTILSVLEDMAIHVGNQRWKLRQDDQLKLQF